MPEGSATAAIHADYHEALRRKVSTDFDVAPPISVATTFTCPETDGDGHVYSRITNPSRDRCEALLSAVEGTPSQPAHAVLYASGLAATFAAFSRVLPRRVAISGGYHGTHLVLDQLRRISGGASFETIVLPSPEEAPSVLLEGDLVWLETPLNPSCDIADIAAYSSAAKARVAKS